MAKWTKTEQAEAIEELHKWVKPGDVLYTNLKSVSRSGMSRVIQVLKLPSTDDRGPLYLGHLAAKAAGYTYNDKADGIRADGCGMDMGFHVVYSLSRVLYPKGFGCVGEKCPSNDHSNGDRDYTPHEEAQKRECSACKGTGEVLLYRFEKLANSEMQTCRTCNGKKQLEAGHWHRDGGYAIQQRWL